VASKDRVADNLAMIEEQFKLAASGHPSAPTHSLSSDSLQKLREAAEAMEKRNQSLNSSTTSAMERRHQSLNSSTTSSHSEDSDDTSSPVDSPMMSPFSSPGSPAGSPLGSPIGSPGSGSGALSRASAHERRKMLMQNVHSGKERRSRTMGASLSSTE